MGRRPLPDASAYASELIPYIRQLLLDLYSHPYPTVPSPPNVPKRASVALIIRIQPNSSHWPSYSELPEESQFLSVEDRLNAFFAQEWVKHGDPEILFIKRAANKNDRWTGHIAFPGGRRDPSDQDDRDAAIRETWEEVGIDLKEESGYAIPSGNLTQTLISANWGATPVLTFCPYIFLLTKPIPPLRLQTTEVASVHWVPIRSLLNPKFRTYWIQDASSRVSREDFGMKRMMARFMTGDMMFAAIRLFPSESKFSTEAAEYADKLPKLNALGSNITVPLAFARRSLEKVDDTGATLLLWGLTLGVIGDFLDMLPPYDIVQTWIYPSWTALDLRFWVWLLSYRLRQANEKQIQEEMAKKEIPSPDDAQMIVKFEEEERYYGRIKEDLRGTRGNATLKLLKPYWKIMYRAGLVAAATRISAAALLAVMVARWFRRLK